MTAPALAVFAVLAVLAAVALLQPAAHGAVVPTTSTPPPTESPDAEGCLVEGNFFPVGGVLNTGPDPCNTYKCQDKDSFYGLTCPPIAPGSGCEIVPGNMSAVFPHCCPQLDCNENFINVDDDYDVNDDDIHPYKAEATLL